ncbi:hypothetical protein OG453_07045 [Streptomyces sp. NBC_01381]|uniref:hypothetical protein n=1 Tax=Streptomyces sp. NBC_01381 TaxID=2903845 RepID=UPI00224DC729|nr:hypothetical protein [Streptomyces sp. NBC_01381]MCX4666424.1 hypothetical protein [Streptomyces sp. NBC_01381]
MHNPVAEVTTIRATYGPEELRALEVYRDLHSALDGAGLHPYIETRGGLAVCAVAGNGTLLVIAGQDALPLRRETLTGWHVSHVPEDGPAPEWRCLVHDTVPDSALQAPHGDMDLESLLSAVTRHLTSCTHSLAARS